MLALMNRRATLSPARLLLVLFVLTALVVAMLVGPAIAKNSAIYNAAPPAVQGVVDAGTPEAEAYTAGSRLVYSTLSDRSSVSVYDGNTRYYLGKGKTTYNKDRFVVPSGCIGYLNVNGVKVSKIGPGVRFMSRYTFYSLNIQC